MKNISDFLNEGRKNGKEYQSKFDVVAMESELQDLVGNKLNVSVSGLELPGNFFNSGLIGTVLEYYLAYKIKTIGSEATGLFKFEIDGDTEESVTYGHADLKCNGSLIEVKANKNLAKDGMKFTDEQRKHFTSSTPIIWIGYSIEGSTIKIIKIKVRNYGDLNINSSGRCYSL